MLGDLGTYSNSGLLVVTSDELIIDRLARNFVEGRVILIVWLTRSLVNVKERRASFTVKVFVDDVLKFKDRHINRARWRPQLWRNNVRLGQASNYVAPTGTFTIDNSGTAVVTFDSFFRATTVSPYDVITEPAPEPEAGDCFIANFMPLWIPLDLPGGAVVKVTVKCGAEKPTIAGGSTGGLSDDFPPPVPPDPDDIIEGLDYDLEPDEEAIDFQGTINARVWKIG